MKFGIALGAVLGVLAAVLMVAWYGLTAVGDALELAGWTGLAAIAIYHFVPVVLCALAWRTLFDHPQASRLQFVWIRWLRDAGSDLLALVPGGGEMLGIRAMKLAGIELGTATASTIVDVTVETFAQIGFTILGLIILLDRPAGPLVPWTLLGLAAIIPLAAALLFAQRLGLIGLIERFADKLAAGYGWTALVNVSGLEERVHAIYRNRSAIARAGATHFLAWIVGVGEAGIALAMMGVRPGFGSLIVLESLTFAIRTAAFFIPAAAGVQEGGYVLLGGALGIAPEFALALSLLKRGRELALGTVALLLWHSIESRLMWRTVRAVPATSAALSPEASPDNRSAPSDRRHS
jgi:putative membrane protein